MATHVAEVSSPTSQGRADPRRTRRVPSQSSKSRASHGVATTAYVATKRLPESASAVNSAQLANSTASSPRRIQRQSTSAGQPSITSGSPLERFALQSSGASSEMLEMSGSCRHENANSNGRQTARQPKGFTNETATASSKTGPSPAAEGRSDPVPGRGPASARIASTSQPSTNEMWTFTQTQATSTTPASRTAIARAVFHSRPNTASVVSQRHVASPMSPPSAQNGQRRKLKPQDGEMRALP